MANVIVYDDPTDGVTVVRAAAGVTVDATLAAKVVPTSISYEIIADSTLPNGYEEFHSAWRLSGSSVTVNLAAAKTVAVDNCKLVAISAIKASRASTDLGETPTHSVSSIQTAFTNLESAINAATAVSTVNTELTNFRSTYEN